MEGCKYFEKCEVYNFLIEHFSYQKCRNLLEICELEIPGDIFESCEIYREFENPSKVDLLNKKEWLEERI